MRKIIYYVATSIDGFISGPNEDISRFEGDGNGVEKYLKDLTEFDTVIMGRKTYEFGYKFGIEPGQPAYPNMTHYIFSNDLTFEKQNALVKIRKPDLDEITKIRKEQGTDIYLCGGGQFAGWLLDNQQIELLKIKLNPLILGQGIRLFGDSKKSIKPMLIDTTLYDNGLQIMTYKIDYKKF